MSTKGERMIAAIKALGLYDVDPPMIHRPVPRTSKVIWIVKYFSRYDLSNVEHHYGYEWDAQRAASNIMVQEIQDWWNLSPGSPEYELAIDINTEIADDEFVKALALYNAYLEKKSDNYRYVIEILQSEIDPFNEPIEMIDFFESADETDDDELVIDLLLGK